MAQINMPRRRETPEESLFSTILTGLNIANQIYGIKANQATVEKLEKDAKAEEATRQANMRRQQNIFTPGEFRGEFGKGYEISEKPFDAGPPGFKTTIRSPGSDSGLTRYVREQQKPVAITTTTPDGGSQVSYKMPWEVQGQTFIAPPKPLTPAQQESRRLAEERLKVSKEARDEAREDKKLRDERERETPFGLARTRTDANKIKDGYVAKQSFDRKLQEMIDLRKEFGAEFADRTAVERGKQLSKDLLLTFKDMKKLGVLSQADEAIINAVIPPDPLAISVSVSGGDPLLNRLEKFKSDMNADFETTLETMLESAPKAERAPRIEITPEQALEELKRRGINIDG